MCHISTVVLFLLFSVITIGTEMAASFVVSLIKDSRAYFITLHRELQSLKRESCYFEVGLYVALVFFFFFFVTWPKFFSCQIIALWICV